jgi:hypothetical protein
VDTDGDIVVENAGEGTDLVKSYCDFTLSENVENLTLMGENPINGIGNTLIMSSQATPQQMFSLDWAAMTPEWWCRC